MFCLALVLWFLACVVFDCFCLGGLCWRIDVAYLRWFVGVAILLCLGARCWVVCICCGGLVFVGCKCALVACFIVGY